jgi:hypothetical protein
MPAARFENDIMQKEVMRIGVQLGAEHANSNSSGKAGNFNRRLAGLR